MVVQSWTLNSFYGAGDTIGVLVDTSQKTASFFKNNTHLGKAFSELPDLLYPFVTLSRPGMSATISMPSGKSMASRSEVMMGGVKRLWIDTSEFGCGDRSVFGRIHACAHAGARTHSQHARIPLHVHMNTQDLITSELQRED